MTTPKNIAKRTLTYLNGVTNDTSPILIAIVRQKYAVRRLNGVRVCFEDNAAVLITPEGETKGTDIKGPVAAEASEKWPRVANLASTVI